MARISKRDGADSITLVSLARETLSKIEAQKVNFNDFVRELRREHRKKEKEKSKIDKEVERIISSLKRKNLLDQVFAVKFNQRLAKEGVNMKEASIVKEQKGEDDSGRSDPDEPNLDLEDEKTEKNDLAIKTITGDALGFFLNICKKFPLLKAKEEKELAIRIKKGDALAREKMINSNLRLVVSIAKRYAFNKPWISLKDCIGYGHIGLIIAVDRFDPSKDLRFSTYAFHWIKQKIERESMNCEFRGIRIPIHKISEIKKAADIIGEECDAESIEKKLGVKKGRAQSIYDAITASKSSYYLNNSIGDDEGERLDFISCDSQDSLLELSPEDLVIKSFTDAKDKEKVEFLSQKLSASEWIVLRRRFGINEDGVATKEMTLDEIGKEFSLSRERVRQIEAKAIKNAKKILLKGGFI